METFSVTDYVKNILSTRAKDSCFHIPIFEGTALKTIQKGGTSSMAGQGV